MIMTMNHHDLAMSDSIPHAYNIPHAYKALFAPMVPTSRVQLSQRFPQESSLIKDAILKQMYTLHAEDSSDRLESIINSLMDESEVPRDALDRFNDFLLKRAKKKIDKEKQSVDRGKGLLRRWVEQDQGIRDDESWEDLLTVRIGEVDILIGPFVLIVVALYRSSTSHSRATNSAKSSSARSHPNIVKKPRGYLRNPVRSSPLPSRVRDNGKTSARARSQGNDGSLSISWVL
ncbi:hypothetical protein C8R42DRAFT_690517 [Lentinula raphanica]|nr:hypothetical protein C8R42DRAFT_690517 [Lentinula raphanica]